MKVVYIPGVLGSNLGYVYGTPPLWRTVWVDPAALAVGGYRYLQLAADGRSPGPLAEGRALVASGVWYPVYGPLAYWMRQLKWDVLELGWDWRQSVITQAASAWPAIRQWAGGERITFVCHSLGGLLARAIYGLMRVAGLDAQLRLMVTIGTPHYGSFESVRVFYRLPTLYRGLTQLSGWGEWLAGTPGPAALDAAIASMPSWYELLPFRSAGPLFLQAPEQAAQLYTAGFYSTGNPYVVPGLLTSAELVQGELDGWAPADRMRCIAGVGYPTAYQLNPPAGPDSDDGYRWTDLGDGSVTLAEAAPLGVAPYTVGADHAGLLLSPQVFALVYFLVAPTGPA